MPGRAIGQIARIGNDLPRPASWANTHAPLLRAYHSLRTVPVPAGSSEVEMWYESRFVRWTFLLWLAAVVAGLILADAFNISRVRRQGAARV